MLIDMLILRGDDFQLPPISKKQQKSVNKYIEKAYDRINLTIKKGTKQALQQAAAKSGVSINGYIKNAITKQYKADIGEDIKL